MMPTKSLGSFEEDVARRLPEVFADYKPAFSLEPAGDGRTWLLDHGRRIALVHEPYQMVDLFESNPLMTRLPTPEIPEVYHAPSLFGARLPLVQWIIPYQGRSGDDWAFSLEAKEDHITLISVERWAALGMESTKIFTLRVHPRFGYVLEVADEVLGKKLVELEPANFFAVGLADHREDKKRFPYVVWRHPTRGILNWRSNMVSCRCFGQTDVRDTRRLGRRGWLGFLGEPDWNPVYAFGEANGEISALTCSNLLDEHLLYHDEPPQNENGEYFWKSSGTLLFIDGRTSDRLIGESRSNDLRTDEVDPDRVAIPMEAQAHFPVDLSKPRNPRVYPFQVNVVSDFEEPIDLTAYYRGQFWPAQEDVADAATITRERSWSGRQSLKLLAGEKDEDGMLTAMGSSLWLDGGRKYRLSCRCSYEGAGARLRMVATQIYYSLSMPLEASETFLEAQGSQDWTLLELIFDAQSDDPAVVVQFFARGAGAFYLDDILLEEISDT